MIERLRGLDWHLWWGKIRSFSATTWVQMAVSSVVTVALLIFVILIWASIANVPPVLLVSQDSDDLGIVCPGDDLPVHNIVEVDALVLAFYYLSTMDESEIFNYPGTQTTFPGFPHPIEATFTQVLPWVVPDLPPGVYKRVVTARGTDGREKPSMLTAKFTIGGNCNEGRESSRYRVGDWDHRRHRADS